MNDIFKPKSPSDLAREVSRLMPRPDQNLASEFYKRLVEWINDFDKDLDSKYEVGVRLVNFGQTFTFHLSNLGYYNPSLISFSGVTDSGEHVKLIQHVSQISILLMKMKRKNPDEPKSPIGFKEDTDNC